MSGNGAKEIFLAAIHIDSSQEREAYLDEACASDQSLRRRLAALLDARAKNNNVNFLEQPVAALAATVAYEPVQEGPTVAAEA